ncbi:MAG: ABC transporter ATP-binding protein [Firmicutes bacterium]|nr:ABC transporter ATP-binding protein [Bacillota bacterium]
MNLGSNYNLLDVNGLKTYFYTFGGVVKAVDGVSFKIKSGETLGIVGESGCGKSVTSLSVMGLIPKRVGKIEAGTILFENEDLLQKNDHEMCKVRGNHISMIFQEPMTSLNPVMTVGDQLVEVFRLHQNLSKQKAKEKTIEMFDLVGVPQPDLRFRSYPFQLSGGLRQRVMIAMALSCNPKLLIADEPTTALDVTIQAQILELMKKLKREIGTAIMFITHDLGVIAEVAERVIVMYGGKIVEEADVITLFEDPKHPYTRGLLDSLPRIDEIKDRLQVIPGTVPDLSSLPQGCKFHPRCNFAMEKCRMEEPHITNLGENRSVSCWLVADKKPEGRLV